MGSIYAIKSKIGLNISNVLSLSEFMLLAL